MYAINCVRSKASEKLICAKIESKSCQVSKTAQMSFLEGFVAELRGKVKYLGYIGDVMEKNILQLKKA